MYTSILLVYADTRHGAKHEFETTQLSIFNC